MSRFWSSVSDSVVRWRTVIPVIPFVAESKEESDVVFPSMSSDEQFTIAFSRMTRGWAVVDSFRRIGFAGIPQATRIVAHEHTTFVADLAASGKLSEIIVGVRGPEDLEKTAIWLREKLTEQAVKNASYSIDAASFVFAHSILDEGLSSFLQITSETAREFWEKRLEEKAVPLALVRAQPTDKILSSFIAKEIRKVRRNASLIDKCDLLHAICRPSGPPANPEYNFDQGRLSELDKLRHDVVHGDLLGSEIADAATKLDYLQQTWIYFFVMLHKTFGLRVDPSKFSRAQKQ
ncbi:MAG TPA: hypothetical protein VF133_06725 [Terriglobales bacterium]